MLRYLLLSLAVSAQAADTYFPPPDVDGGWREVLDPLALGLLDLPLRESLGAGYSEQVNQGFHIILLWL